jgi:hypothetical protein
MAATDRLCSSESWFSESCIPELSGIFRRPVGRRYRKSVSASHVSRAAQFLTYPHNAAVGKALPDRPWPNNREHEARRPRARESKQAETQGQTGGSDR